MLFKNWKKEYYNLKREYLNTKLALMRNIDSKDEAISNLTDQVIEINKLKKSNSVLKSYNAKYKERIKAQDETIKEQLLLIETLQKENKKRK